jgi:RsiW-degrading membrane proteinase PrsW (M82 family)
MAQRIIDLTLAVLASIVSFLLSWPYWRDFEYWPESHGIWLVYFVLGFVLAVYVFYIFLISLHTLFLHGSQDHASAQAASQDTAATDQGVQS